MSDVMAPDGTVISSSQVDPEEYDPKSYDPKIGVVVSIQPSDDVDNLSSAASKDGRGHRHECQVVVYDEDQQSNMLLEHVVIPPRNRSNYDDYDEDLPIGTKGTLSKSDLPPNWKNIPITDLDGDMCLVQFIGGSRERPYISDWWPHPANRLDPATSGQASLQQVDLNQQRSRVFRRVNGVEQLLTAQGDVYFDTSKAGSKIDLKGTKPVRREVTKGGSIQIDIKASQQLEFNWNAPVEGLKTGSNTQSQERESQRPHLDHSKATGTPAARGTDETILRFKKQEGTVSTGKMVIYCHTKGDGDGFFMATAEEGVVIGQGETGETLAMLAIADGKITLSTPEGANITLQDDAVSVTTKDKASVTLSGDQASLVAPGGVSLGTATPVDSVVLGTLFMTTYLPVLNFLDAVLKAAQGPVAALTATKQAAGTIGSGNALVPLFDAILDSGKLTQWLTAALAHGAAAPAPASTPLTTPWLSKLVSASK